MYVVPIYLLPVALPIDHLVSIVHGGEPGICANCITLLPLGVGFGGLINVNVVFLLSVWSIVFVLRQNVQHPDPEVCSWFHGYTVLCVMDLL